MKHPSVFLLTAGLGLVVLGLFFTRKKPQHHPREFAYGDVYDGWER